ncbi:MAG: M4 family metallopeptidase [Pseudomonadota bacterium]
MRTKTALSSAAFVVALGMSVSSFAAQPARQPAVERAQGLLLDGAVRKAARIADADRLAVKDVVVDRDGTEHVRMTRSYRGLPVIGGDIVVSSRGNRMKALSRSLATSARPEIAPRISPLDAIVEAGASFKGTMRQHRNHGLVIWARGAQPRLAYQVQIQGSQAGRQSADVMFFVDADTGAVLDIQDQLQTVNAVGTGKSLLVGNVSINTDFASNSYALRDLTRGSGAVYDAANRSYTTAARRATLFTDADNVWGNNATTDRATVGVDIAYGVAMTWDYYKNTHGRNGIFNNGTGVKSYAHTNFGSVGGPNGGINAAWYANAMYYGDGDLTYGYLPIVSIDVAGHEMSHGVNQATANLAYSGDAGGLNEGNSDIMGTLVEFYANNANDPGDYVIGEELITNNATGTKGFRTMFKQDADGKSFSCYPVGGFNPALSSGAHNPHYTSGVANRFFYLLAEGAVVPSNFVGTYTASQLVCNGNTALTGIGRAKAGAIWYRALSTKFTSSTTYPQARAGTLQAAAELYGSGSPEYNAVAAAWSAVSVN